ncbi:MAG: MCE family protein [Kofleriaceae bacterium]|nr:MCE family protein [Kofleriaceae bacterium]
MNLRVGILLLLTIVVGVFAFSFFSTEEEQTLIRARMDDVQGLPIGAPVTIAGLEVGTITNHRIGPGHSEIDIHFLESVKLRSDAILYKKRYSLLSGPHLEIDPGTALEPLRGQYIKHVVETIAIGDVLSDISEALPAVQEMSISAQHRANELRAHLNGPYKDYIESLDSATVILEGRMHNRLSRIDNALKSSENLEYDVEAAVNPKIERAEELALHARESLEQAQAWVNETAKEARQKVDDTKIDWSDYTTPIKALDEGEGQLGKLLNNPELHDDVVELTAQARSYMRSLVTWQMKVGLRGEIATRSGQVRGYISVKAGRTNRFYYLELVTSSHGGSPEISVQQDQGTWRRAITIPNKLRITAQFARRYGPAVFRYGIKESTFGAGANLEFFDNRLELSADIFEIGLQDRPHIKVAASYEIFGGLFIRAGLDDILNPLQRYTIVSGNESQTLSEVYVGRDFFLGASLRFSDRDLAALMRIGGSALGGLGN